jgi:eukaryotic-like serine/threonine-protein kinase
VIGARTTTLGNRYRLEEVIGRGGMSTVYRASDLQLGRTVAVKVLLPALADQDPSYAERFQREARAAAALASSAVVTVYDTGEDEGAQYIVMEYVAGHSLANALRDEQPLAVPEALRIAERVAAALAAAHAAGILHRDIKPANVMVAGDGTVKLLDFGIARKLDGTTLTQVASVVGTAAYMAPERALGQTGDARADVYSLGCLLHAMLTGRPPFAGEVAAAVLHQQINSEPRPPSALRSGLRPEIDALVLAMLAKAPEERPGSAAEVQQRLAWLSGSSGEGEATAPLPESASLAATRVLPERTVPVESRGPGPRRNSLGGEPAAAARPAPPGRRAALADHRRRAVVMAVITGVLALVAVALLAGGGSPRHTAAPSHTAPARTAPGTTPRTAPVSTAAPPAATKPVTSTPKPAAKKPKPPAAAPAPVLAGPAPPGHGGKARGKDKHGGGP